MTPPTLSKLVVSTRNRHKLDEIHAIMTDLSIELIALDDFPDAPEVIEDADTLDGNASKKSEQLFVHTGLPTMADDTGLEVLALGGAPGLYSARYAGPHSSDAANRQKLLREMEGAKDRSAQFRTVIAFSSADGTYLFEGVCPGRIIHEERGHSGFGYDPVFIPNGFEQTFAEMPPESKNRISHRAQALRRFVSYLSGLMPRHS